MNTVGEILGGKGGGSVWSVTPQTTVYETLERMAEHDVGAMLIMENGNLVGIFTERDYARKVILKGRSSRNSPVGEFMTTEVFFVTPAETDADCMRLMTNHRVRHIPVLDGSRVIGVVSVGDVLKTLLRDREFQLEQLENYITGSPYPAAPPP